MLAHWESISISANITCELIYSTKTGEVNYSAALLQKI
jgi:hypothetical protein